ncbi:MAG: nuclear transport factor 2 family protein [Betaproteobacteria bacterium]|nr:nuclear transport factor 2 family protein [Betaproteobacteria bacterium]
MKQLSGLLLGLAILGLAAASPARAGDCGGPVTAEEALASEDARYAAQMGDDFGAMQKLYGDDLVYIHSSAIVDNKATYIDSMKSGTVKYRNMQRSDVTVRTYGCVAIISGLGNFDVTVKGQDVAVEIRFHSIWAKRDKGLQFISWEATRTQTKP